jgi:ubiquinone/menaquinone biosynthesis C-methylase UbiE
VGWLMSRLYDRMLAGAEQAGLRAWRRELVGRAQGAVLEVGAGTGGNLGLYPPGVSRLVLAEPDRHMRAVLRSKLGNWPEVEVSVAAAEALPFADGSFDTVVGTLVLCSVRDPGRALAEIHRVLRPGGTFLFLEHVAAPRGTWTRRAQRLVEPAWKRLAANCHLTRETGALLEGAGFELTACLDEPLPGSAVLSRRSLRGAARPVALESTARRSGSP